jgi:predicted ribosome quality control (RQC) complex YloA/Tae2 family protein
MNVQLLSQIVEELSALITGARVERVYQGTGGGLYMNLNRGRKKFILLFSPDRAMPRLHLVTAKPLIDDPAHGFILFIRSHVSGARIMNIALLNQDRVVEFRFTRSEKEYRLVFELFGPAVNLIFIDSSSKVLSVYYPVSPGEHVVRPLLPGMQYVLPEKKPTRSSDEALLVATGTGAVSPNQTAERYYERLIEQEQTLSIRAEILSRLKKSLSKTVRLISALSNDLRSAEQGEEYRQLGDLVLANLNTLKKGMEHAELRGYDGKTVSVRLDPKRSPGQNAEWYFKKYKKAKAGRDIIVDRLQQANDGVFYLKSMRAKLDQAEDQNDFIDIRAELVDKGYLTGGREKQGKALTEGASPVYRKIVFQGWEILVGKSAAGNDYITMKIARSDDLWFHAEGLPGSHVLVRNPRNEDIPPEVQLKAAALAAFYSKGRSSGKVSVTYTRAGLVRKPKGAKPGLVTLAERKSVMVRPENE